MLEKLHLKNVGPAPEFEMELASRVNLITGDNGLGKSFLLELGFFALMGRMPVNIRPSTFENRASIETQVSHRKGARVNAWSSRKYKFDFLTQMWSDRVGSDGQKTNVLERRMVLHHKVDGTFVLLNPFRANEPTMTELASNQVWDGKRDGEKYISNGLIRDWTKWQLENGDAFKQFKAALETLSPHETEKLEPGKLTRVSLDDARDIPTLKMPYGQEVPIIHASAGIRRIVSLAYMLVWTWQEHLRAAELTRQEPAKEIVLLIDELEQHLHPRWQRVILRSVLETVKQLMKSDVRVQIIATTHSPLVMSSLEPVFDEVQDAWFDLNLIDGVVKLEKMPWRKRGDASAWLTSEAFDLPSSGSVDRESVLDRAGKAMTNTKLSKKQFQKLDAELRSLLGETDPFWIRWRYMAEKKGLL